MRYDKRLCIHRFWWVGLMLALVVVGCRPQAREDLAQSVGALAPAANTGGWTFWDGWILPDSRQPLIARISPNGQYVVVASWLQASQQSAPLEISLWDLNPVNPVWTIQPPQVNLGSAIVSDFAWIPQYNLLAVAVWDSPVWKYMAFNLSSGLLDWVYTSGSSSDPRYSPQVLWLEETDTLLVTSPQGYVEMFKAPSFTFLGRLRFSDEPKCCQVTRMGRSRDTVFFFYDDGRTPYYRLAVRSVQDLNRRVADHVLDVSTNGEIFDMAATPSGSQVAFLYWAHFAEYPDDDTTRGRLIAFNTVNGLYSGGWRRGHDFPEGVRWSPLQDHWLVAWSQDVWMWTPNSSQVLQQLSQRMDAYRGIDLTPNGKRLLLYGTTFYDGVLEVWDQ